MQTSEEDEDIILTWQQLCRHLFCPRQMHLALMADEVTLRAWRLREPDVDPPPWPDLPSPTTTLELRALDLPVSGSIDICSTDVQTFPVLRHNSPPRSEGVWPEHHLEASLSCLLASRALGIPVSGALVLYRGDAFPRPVSISAQDLDLALAHLTEALATARHPDPPPPLVDDLRCGACGLLGLCLPDETRALSSPDGSVVVDPSPERALSPRDDVLPLHVQQPGVRISHSGEVLVVSKSGKPIEEVLLKDVSQLVLHGPVHITTPALVHCLNLGIPVAFHGTSGWFQGLATGLGAGDVVLRSRQYALLDRPEERLRLARRFVAGKIGNQRTQLRRNGRDVSDRTLADLDDLEHEAQQAPTHDVLRGLEGRAARLYFASFGKLLRPRPGTWSDDIIPMLQMDGRNRRPPRDPVNAMLSYAYAVLVRECHVALLSCGLDPLCGLLHVPRPGRPALALDLMEEFRPVAADSAVFTAINTGMVGPNGFQQLGEACWLTSSGRKGLLNAWENRLDQMATHPVFDQRVSLRRIIRLQARLLARNIRGETSTYIPYRVK